MAEKKSSKATKKSAGDTTVRPFHLEIPKEAVLDLQARLEGARWPTKEPVGDWSQGVQLEMLRALADYWSSDYEFSRLESRLNALPQFMTEIDGLDIHF